jgi:small subunit ribosomal protein S16
LRRTGTKGRPYYRVVVAHSTSGRNSKLVENLGTYDPVVKPSKIVIDEEKALGWLLQGAQPSETAAYILNKVGVLGKFLEQRPGLKKQYRFLDKRTAAISVASAIETQAAPVAVVAPAPVAEAAQEPTPEPAAAPVAVEPTAEAVAEPAAPTEENAI